MGASKEFPPPFSRARRAHGLDNVGLPVSCAEKPDSAEKPYECFDKAQHERKISNDFARSSVRPEALEG